MRFRGLCIRQRKREGHSDADIANTIAAADALFAAGV